jgi:hypothetical protein
MSATREQELQQLEELLAQHGHNLTQVEAEAFSDMREALLAYGANDGRYRLTENQRVWLQRVRERVVPQYENLVSNGLVPRGREVPTPAVLLNLPKKPPRKRASE